MIDLFYVIANDGIWDVMEPQEVVEMIYGICRGPMTHSDNYGEQEASD